MRRTSILILGSVALCSGLPAHADSLVQDAVDAYTSCLTAHATDTANRDAAGNVDPDAVKADCSSERQTLQALLPPDVETRVISTLDANTPDAVENIAEAAQ